MSGREFLEDLAGLVADRFVGGDKAPAMRAGSAGARKAFDEIVGDEIPQDPQRPQYNQRALNAMAIEEFLKTNVPIDQALDNALDALDGQPVGTRRTKNNF